MEEHYYEGRSFGKIAKDYEESDSYMHIIEVRSLEKIRVALKNPSFKGLEEELRECLKEC